MLKAIKWFVADYTSRHRHNVDIWLHIIGIPLAFYGIFQLFTGDWKTGLLNLFIGYLLQWIGHTYFDKNEVGEWILIKSIAKKLIKSG
ncbi:MAG: DUF962 domain-containing protein [Candidatus Omnitrophica bacterium]|nr:DUF962 domain-containing protein [Candidatus Omnitrophota bacterium]